MTQIAFECISFMKQVLCVSSMFFLEIELAFSEQWNLIQVSTSFSNSITAQNLNLKRNFWLPNHS